MFGLIADTEARESLVSPTTDTVDFRAACFCHGRVVDQGFVCSICLSIFCELPDDAECLTCGTKLALGNYGSKPAVVPRKKKKKKRIANGTGREDTGSAAGTPRPA
jgi:transcription initiation factor TFIIH subunit 3